MYIENQASWHSPPPSHTYVIARPCHVTIPGRRGGGDPPRHRSREPSFIGGEFRALGLVGPMPRLKRKNTRKTHLFSVRTRQAHIRPRRLFFAYRVPNINFKGVHMQLKIVGLKISVEQLIIMNFYDVLQLSYRPSNFARANKPYAAG